MINYITQQANSLLHNETSPHLDILLLQYGSAYFEADTDSSDFDLLMVVKYKSVENLYGNEEPIEIEQI